MPKTLGLSYEDVSAKIAYDPESGTFTWKGAPSRRQKAGEEAGTVKSARRSRKSDKISSYKYIHVNGVQTPAARIAWLLHYGKEPAGLVMFKDGNTLNLRIDNLTEAMFRSKIYKSGDGRRIYRMSLEAQRHYGRKRYYGLTGEEYGAMLAEQRGVCAICGKPETAMLNGTPKQLHVDHCHTTNRIRSLLCGACNGMLGLAKDNVETLRAAADYLERHKAFPSLRLVTGSVRNKESE